MIASRSDRLALVRARVVLFAPLLYLEVAADEDDKVRNSLPYGAVAVRAMRAVFDLPPSSLHDRPTELGVSLDVDQ
jgi:hypothetical protein